MHVVVFFFQQGIVGNVTIDGKIITDWQIYPVHLENINLTTTKPLKRRCVLKIIILFPSLAA